MKFQKGKLTERFSFGLGEGPGQVGQHLVARVPAGGEPERVAHAGVVVTGGVREDAPLAPGAGAAGVVAAPVGDDGRGGGEAREAAPGLAEAEAERVRAVGPGGAQRREARRRSGGGERGEQWVEGGAECSRVAGLGGPRARRRRGAADQRVGEEAAVSLAAAGPGGAGRQDEGRGSQEGHPERHGRLTRANARLPVAMALGFSTRSGREVEEKQ